MSNGKLGASSTQWLRGALVGACALAACAHRDQPVPVSGAAKAASALQSETGESAGVRMIARARAWNGNPPTLSQYVFPVWVEVENHSGKTLWLRYDSFRVEAPPDNPEMLRAVPPSQVKGNAIIPVSAVPPEFRLADEWIGEWVESDFDQNVAHAHWREHLPTREMLRRGIREGVMADGRKVAGFIYFQKTRPDVAGLTLSADLVDAATNQSFGRIEIPLTVEDSH
ncbi:MAG TPA: hypothetical protein VJ860_12155 [Polyangia bacterium]|jgi:hypothetical protein|nr:hypothetical protein [Polyangia bacterium]